MSLTSGNHHHQSAKMMQAQAYFQQIVKQELQCLLSQAIDRDVAVKQLLHRIVECTETPHEQDIKRVMKQFQMQYDDAVRALIVKQVPLRSICLISLCLIVCGYRKLVV